MSRTSPGESAIAYVLARGEREGPVLSDELDKTLHVSPLMGMDQTYAFRASEPGERLAVHIESRPREGEAGKSFDATLSLRRRELSRPLLPGCWPATRRCRCRWWRRSTPSRCG